MSVLNSCALRSLFILFTDLNYIYIYIYIRSRMGVEHSAEGIFGCRSHNAKFFERI